MLKTLFSNKKTDWETPINLFNELNKRYNFTLDVCANENNFKVINYINEEKNGLLQDWNNNICWMNPPYGKEIGKWVEKALFESKKENCTVVSLLPARTDTKWFHNYILNQSNVEIIFMKGRLKFGDSKNSAYFSSMVVLFK